MNPCPILEKYGGVWVFDGTKLNQTPANGRRFATGMRNAVAIEWNAAQNALFSVIHGRDSLDTLFPALYNAEDNATRQAEEFHQIVDGGDYGWPYTFFDTKLGKRVLAPEYGGDAKKEPEAGKYPDPLVAYPAHWAPNDLLFYSGKNFPAKYQGGAFIAFHGSWNRAPEPQAGYKVVFQPMKDGKPNGRVRSVRRWIRRRDEGQQPAQCAIPPGRPRGRARWLAVRFRLAEGPHLAHLLRRKMMPRASHLAAMVSGVGWPARRSQWRNAARRWPTRRPPGQRSTHKHCLTCHQADGGGVPNMQPAIAGGTWVKGDARALALFVMTGGFDSAARKDSDGRQRHAAVSPAAGCGPRRNPHLHPAEVRRRRVAGDRGGRGRGAGVSWQCGRPQ